MASISSLGIGSGMDLNALVSQLVALERKPLDLMRTEASKLQNKVSLFGQMKSYMSALQDTASKLAGSSLWTQTKALSADPAAVSVTTTTGSTAGNYAVNVTSLAAGQSVVGGDTFASTGELVGSGTLTIDIGSWNAGATAFTPKNGGSPVAITIDAGDTLATMRDKINAAGAGVTASIVTDASGSRLSIRSKDTGVENGFRVGVADDDGNPTDTAGLSRFAYDPPSGQTQLSRTQAGTNAVATVNGITVSSTTNSLDNVVEGLNLKLYQVTTAPVDVGVSTDTEAITKAAEAFAKAYSDLAGFIKAQTKYDESSKASSPLQGDSTATGLLNQMRALINSPSAASAAFPRLSDIGLQLQADGTMTLNSAKFETALGNLGELRKAFSNSDANDPSNNGFAKRYAILATDVLGTDGSLTTRTDSLQKMIKANGEKQDRLNDRVDQIEKRLIAQYSAMDAKMAQFNALSTYLTQQLSMFAAGLNQK